MDEIPHPSIALSAEIDARPGWISLIQQSNRPGPIFQPPAKNKGATRQASPVVTQIIRNPRQRLILPKPADPTVCKNISLPPGLQRVFVSLPQGNASSAPSTHLTGTGQNYNARPTASVTENATVQSRRGGRKSNSDTLVMTNTVDQCVKIATFTPVCPAIVTRNAAAPFRKNSSIGQYRISNVVQGKPQRKQESGVQKVCKKQSLEKRHSGNVVLPTTSNQISCQVSANVPVRAEKSNIVKPNILHQARTKLENIVLHTHAQEITNTPAMRSRVGMPVTDRQDDNALHSYNAKSVAEKVPIIIEPVTLKSEGDGRATFCSPQRKSGRSESVCWHNEELPGSGTVLVKDYKDHLPVLWEGQGEWELTKDPDQNYVKSDDYTVQDRPASRVYVPSQLLLNPEKSSNHASQSWSIFHDTRPLASKGVPTPMSCIPVEIDKSLSPEEEKNVDGDGSGKEYRVEGRSNRFASTWQEKGKIIQSVNMLPEELKSQSARKTVLEEPPKYKISIKGCNTVGLQHLLQAPQAKVSLYSLPDEWNRSERIVWVNDTLIRSYEDDSASILWHFESGKWVKGRSQRSRKTLLDQHQRFTMDGGDIQQDVDCNDDDYTALACEDGDDSSDGSVGDGHKKSSNKKVYQPQRTHGSVKQAKEHNLREKIHIQRFSSEKPADNVIGRKYILVTTCCSKCYTVGETEISTVCKGVLKLLILCDQCYDEETASNKSSKSEKYNAESFGQPCKSAAEDQLSMPEISQPLEKGLEESLETRFSGGRQDGMNDRLDYIVVNDDHSDTGYDSIQISHSDNDESTFSVNDAPNVKPQSACLKRKLDEEKKSTTDKRLKPLKKKSKQDKASGGKMDLVKEICRKCKKVGEFEPRMLESVHMAQSKLCLKCREDEVNKSVGHPNTVQPQTDLIRQKTKSFNAGDLWKDTIRDKHSINMYNRELADFVQFGILSSVPISEERKTCSIKFQCWKCRATGTTTIYAKAATNLFVHKLCDSCFGKMRNPLAKLVNGSNGTGGGTKIDDGRLSDCARVNCIESDDEKQGDDPHSVESHNVHDGNDSTFVSRNEIFEKVVNEPCDICGLHLNTFHDLIEHKWLKHKERMCLKCGKVFLTSGQLELHMKLHMCRNEEFTCRLCGEKSSNLMRHLLKAHKEKNCHICGMFIHRDATTHFQLHVRSRFLLGGTLCPIYDCGFEVKTLDLFLRHMWLYHNERACFVCKEAKFSTLDSLLCHFSQHMESPIDVGPMHLKINDAKTPLILQAVNTDLSCQNCHLRFSNLLGLSKHQWLFHSLEMSGGSLIRNFKFPSQLAHEKHRKNITINKCQICHIEKGSIYELSAHLWTDHKCHRCIVCLQEVRNAEDLGQHLQEFLNEFPEETLAVSRTKCPKTTCCFSALNTAKLIQHMWSTHGLEECPICGQKCAFHKHVFYHIVMHQCEGVPNPKNWDHCLVDGSINWNADTREKCPLCSFVSPHFKVTLLHMWDEHGLRKCLLCDVPHIYTHIYYFVCHMSSHFKKKNPQYPCFFCNVQFASQPRQVEHSLQKHGVRAVRYPFHCTKCKIDISKHYCSHKSSAVSAKKMVQCMKCDWVGPKVQLSSHMKAGHEEKTF